MSWDRWEPWAEMYREWEKRIGRIRIVLTYPSLKGLWRWFAREIEMRKIDPVTIDVQSYVDPMLTADENKEILKSIMYAPITEDNTAELYKEAKAMLQEHVRKKYPEIIEPLEERIIELERTEKTSRRRYQKIKALELELAESERLREEEKRAREAKAPAIPKHKHLADEEVERLWQEFIRYAEYKYGALIIDPNGYRERFDETIKPARTFEEAAAKATRLVDRIARELKPRVPRRVRAPILEPVERELDFETYLKRCGIDMEDYRLLGYIGQTVMRQEYRRWKKDPW